jgi:hypothetical protein
MDPIQSLISGADPVRREPAGPDAEAALRQALKEGPVFSDSRSGKVLNFDHRRRSRARLAGVLTLTAAAVTAGVLVTTNLGALVSAPSPRRSNRMDDLYGRDRPGHLRTPCGLDPV